MNYAPLPIIVIWLKWGYDSSYLPYVYIDILIFFFSKKLCFTLYLKVFTLLHRLTASDKSFEIKGPKYDKHFWVKALVLSGWNSFK